MQNASLFELFLLLSVFIANCVVSTVLFLKAIRCCIEKTSFAYIWGTAAAVVTAITLFLALLTLSA